MSKRELTKEDFELMNSTEKLTQKDIINTEDLEIIKEVYGKYEDILKDLGDGRKTKNRIISEEEMLFIFQNSRLAYTIYNQLHKK